MRGVIKLDVDPDIRKAWTPPSAWYTDEATFKASREAVLSRSWQWITQSDPLKVPGAVFPFTMLEGCLDEPLMFVRDMEDTLRCLSNVCTHRGNLVAEGAAVERGALRCRYHGRKFGLDGRFLSMPEFEGCEGFPCESDNLATVPHAEWGGHLFASLKPLAPFETWLEPMLSRLPWLPVEDFKYAPSLAREYLVRCHWALYCDNYLEGFHIPYVHASLNTALDYGQYSIELFRYGSLQLGIGKGEDETFDIPAGEPDHGRNVSAYYFWFFPNVMFNFYPWGLSVNVVRPIAPDVTKVSFIPLVWRQEKLGRGAGAELDRVEREDEAIVEMVQKGLRSRIYRAGRYSPTRERGTHHFHRLLSEFTA